MAAVIGGIFFLMEHDLSISLDADYTQTAEEMETTSGGGNLIRRVGFFALASLGAYLLAVGRGRLQVRWPLLVTILAYFGWCFASVTWAGDPGICLRRLIVLACALMGALGLSRACSVREMTVATVLITATIALVGILAETAQGTFRPWSGDYRFSGTVHPNTQGMLLTTLALGSFCLTKAWPERHTLWWLLVSAALVLLVLTKSRTSLAAALVAMGAVATLQTSLRLKVTVGLVCLWLMAAGVLLLCLAGVDPVSEFVQAALLGRSEEAESLSGRHLIWPEVWYYVQQRFWLGYGYESFWTADRIEIFFEQLGWGVREAHNGYLETLLTLGAIGLSLAVVLVLTGIVTSAAEFLRRRDATYGLPVGVLVFGLLNAGLESAMSWLFMGTFLTGCCLLRIAVFDSPVPAQSSFPASSRLQKQHMPQSLADDSGE